MAGTRDQDARIVGDRYRLLEPLGSGGMGTVWRAFDETLHREVAVKEVVLPSGADPAERETLLERSMREARAAAQIDHPNVVKVFDAVQEDGRPWIVMEHVRGRSLAGRLRADGPLPPAEVADIGLAVLGGLEAAHSAGVTHRDVKPGNVLLADDGRVLLTDFGVAARSGDSTLTRTGTLVGSPAYVAPERARGTTTPASDLWSLGATLHAAVEGASPFDRSEVLASVTAALTEPAPAADHAGPALQRAITALLEKDPARRADVARARELLEHAARTSPDRTATTLVAGAAAAQAGDETAELPVAAAEQAPAAAQASPPAAAHASPPAAAPASAPAPAPTPGPAPSPEPDPSPRPPAAAAPRPRRTRHRSTPVLVGLGLVVLVGLVALLAATLGGGAPKASPQPKPSSQDRPTPSTGSDAPTSPAPSPTGRSSSPAPTTSSAGADSAVPAGYTRYRDAGGWSVAVPDGWVRSSKGGHVDFTDPKGHRLLRLAHTTDPKPDPVADWKHQETSVSKRLPGYHRIRIEPVDYRSWKTADWEFTFDGNNGRVHVLDRGFTTGTDGFAIYLSTAESAWKDSQDVFGIAARTFRASG